MDSAVSAVRAFLNVCPIVSPSKVLAFSSCTDPDIDSSTSQECNPSQAKPDIYLQRKLIVRSKQIDALLSKAEKLIKPLVPTVDGCDL